MKFTRAARLVFQLMEHEQIDESMLRTLLPVKKRKIKRYIKAIDATGIKIKYDDERRTYHLHTKRVMNRKHVTLSQINRLKKTISGKHVKLSYENTYRFVSQVIDSQMYIPEICFCVFPWIPQDNLTKLYLAQKRKQLVKIEYTDTKEEKTIRVVEPMEVFYQGGNWYLWAYCRLRNAPRFFKVENMSILDDPTEYFVRRPLKITQRQADQSFMVDLKFEPSLRKQVYHGEWPGKIFESSDGIMVVGTELYNQKFARKKLLPYIGQVQVMYPLALEREMAKYF